MAIRITTIILAAGFLSLLSVTCSKRIDSGCKKMGYEYVHTQSLCWYSPVQDSLVIGSTIILTASVPRTFIDENTRSTVTNLSAVINGPLHVLMISPSYQAAVDSFELTAEVGKIIKDTVHFSIGQLKGFRTLEWDGSAIDSFRIRIKINPIAKGIYAFSLGQQAYVDKDCALYKYFLKPGNSNQHLNYWMNVFGNVSDQVAFFTYCFKVY